MRRNSTDYAGILCANSLDSLNNWLQYDYVGAPWSPNSRFGGNGGLSLRRISPIIQILRQQSRIPHTDPEDVWLSSRLGHRPGAVVANGSESVRFSAENIWHEDPMPMGYHTGSSGKILPGGIWGEEAKREKIWKWVGWKSWMKGDDADRGHVGIVLR